MLSPPQMGVYISHFSCGSYMSQFRRIFPRWNDQTTRMLISSWVTSLSLWVCCNSWWGRSPGREGDRLCQEDCPPPHPQQLQFTCTSYLGFERLGFIYFHIFEYEYISYHTPVSGALTILEPLGFAPFLMYLNMRVCRGSQAHSITQRWPCGSPHLLVSCIPNDFLQIMQALFFFQRKWNMRAPCSTDDGENS